jgi:hypothetical protein
MANACISLAGALRNHLKLVLVAPAGASVSVFPHFSRKALYNFISAGYYPALSNAFDRERAMN